jgi:type I restriction enzyme M protein
MSLSNTVKAIQDIMRKDAGVDGDAQRIGQLGWMLFLKIYSDLELETELEDTKYKSPIPKKFRWESWADESAAGKDALTGDALINFINNELFPKLKELDLSSFTGQARERGALLISVFDDAYNYMKNGTLLRQVINKINQDIDYNSVETRHLFGDIYEQILRDLQSAGNAGEYYTPRAVTQFAIEMVNPQLGEIVLDPACGTGGFLTGAFEHMKKQVKKPAELKALKNSIKGVEKKPLPHVLCATNMMVHGIEVPSNIINDNTLAKPLRDYGKSDQVDVIVTNPPFGGVEEDGIENNFPLEFRTRETADLFLVLVMELLKNGGRAAILLPDGTLFGEGVKTKIKKKMLEEFNLHTIIRLPKSVFAPYTSIASNVLFMTKGEPTKEIWYFEHKLPEGVKAYNKTKPMRLAEFEQEKEWWLNRRETEQSWKVSVLDIVKNNYNLDVKNPNSPVETHDDPTELLRRFNEASKNEESITNQIKESLKILEGTKAAMNSLIESFEVLAESAGGITRLRELILKLAIAGKLVTQNSDEGTGKDLLMKIFSQRGLSVGLENEPSSDLPKTWARAKLGELLYLEMGQSPDSDSYNQREVGLPFYQGKTDFGSFIPTPRIWCSSPTKIAEPGDVLLSVRAPVGPTNYVEERSCIGRGLAALRPLGGMKTQFVLWWLRAYESQIADMGTGTTFIAVSKKNLEPFVVNVPPLAEQSRIVDRINQLMDLCNELESAQKNRSQLAEKFARSIVSASG